IDAPAFTVGDEFQGSYRTVGAAIEAALAIRLAVAPEIDVRFGIGWGAVTVLDAGTGIQDGPGWWTAREA
ncbi:SatD family protein, partial [Mycolicibacterium elephantis]